MNILLCSTGINALGETFTLALFAQELEEQGHKCFFIAPKLGKRYLITFGFKDDDILVLTNAGQRDKSFDPKINKLLLEQFEKQINPNYILVADWHHYRENGISNNNTYSINWFDKNTPMGTFDHVGFAPDGKVVKQDQISNVAIQRDFQEKEFPPLQERFSFIIRPCPHHNNTMVNQKSVYYWGIYKKKINKNISKKKTIHEKFNISSKSKIVFQPVGLWQERVIDKVFEEINIKHNYYDETLFPIILNYLLYLNIDITYIVISGKLKKEEVRQCGNVKFIKVPPLNHNEFMNLLMTSDLFITDNLMSSNLGKAVFGNVLSLVFKNSLQPENSEKLKSEFQVSKFIDDKISFLLSNNLMFPYRSFPIGLNELEDMYERNLFKDCFIETEIFNETYNNKLFIELLLKNEISNRIKKNQNNYIANNSNLYSAERILKLNKISPK